MKWLDKMHWVPQLLFLFAVSGHSVPLAIFAVVICWYEEKV